ncbi:MAG: hypothetical protein IJH34_05265, partial [Romboutsia sp.]|nr:hypothetical protein [Romboutsia sp.]
ITIDDNNLDNLIKSIEDYDNNRTNLINNINLNEVKSILTNEDINSYILKLKNNQSKINDIISDVQIFCKKNLQTINKNKKINIYGNSYNLVESNFINIVK